MGHSMILERVKNLNWNKLTSTQKHMVLMYLYRLDTDFENIDDYIETDYFIKMKLDHSDIPQNILNLNTDQKRKMAYAVIGAKIENF